MKAKYIIILNVCLFVFFIAFTFFIGFHFYPNASYKFTSGFQFTYVLFILFSLIHFILRMCDKTKKLSLELTLLALAYLVWGIYFSFVSFIPPDYNIEDQQKRVKEALERIDRCPCPEDLTNEKTTESNQPTGSFE